MKHNASGFSLVELLLVVAIIATLAAISLPVYANALRQARTARAIGDINTIGFDIMVFQMTTGPFRALWPKSVEKTTGIPGGALTNISASTTPRAKEVCGRTAFSYP